MFKLLALLCGTIFLTLLIGGRDGGPMRYGLVPGKMASLVYGEPGQVETEPVAVATLEPVPQAAAPKPKAQQPSGVIEAAFVAPVVQAQPELAAESQSALTLSLPLVTPGRAAVVAEAPAPEAEQVIQYVQGSSVNVRTGPSADTEALTKLGRGEAVLVLPSDTPGWSLIRIEGDGVEGYIASRFLGASADAGQQDGLFSNPD